MNLVLHLKFEYYDQIKRGEKLEEYRLAEKWEKRIVGKNFDNVVLWRGYQSGVFMVLPWQGYTRKTITHPHFGNAPVEVFAINVRAQQSAHADAGDSVASTSLVNASADTTSQTETTPTQRR